MTEPEQLFEEFYKKFPRRVKPFNARKAYDKALTHDTHEAIMEGLERFIEAEPWHGEIQYCPHPASWLNAGEWLNEYAEDSPFRHMTYDERREWSERFIKDKGLKVV